jgi:hypothetical protein
MAYLSQAKEISNGSLLQYFSEDVQASALTEVMKAATNYSCNNQDKICQEINKRVTEAMMKS